MAPGGASREGPQTKEFHPPPQAFPPLQSGQKMWADRFLLCPQVSLTVPFVMERSGGPRPPASIVSLHSAQDALANQPLARMERDRFPGAISRSSPALHEIQGVLEEIRTDLPPLLAITPSFHPVLQGFVIYAVVAARAARS